MFSYNKSRTLGEAGYADLLDKGKGMVYLSDTCVEYYHIAPNDPCEGHLGDYVCSDKQYTVNFKVQVENKEVRVTAFKREFSHKNQCLIYKKDKEMNQNIDKLYNGYELKPNVRHLLGDWRFLDEDTFTKAIDDGDKELVEELLEYGGNYSWKFMKKSIMRLMDQSDGGWESKAKKARKGDK